MARVWSTSEEGTDKGAIDAMFVELDSGKIYNVAWLRHDCDDRDIAHALKVLLHIVETGKPEGMPVMIRKRAA